MKFYAVVRWTPSDVQSLRPGMTDDEAAEWLADNERYVQDRLIEIGWEVLEALLPPISAADNAAFAALEEV
jgi:hypothetical protein